jgi:Zn-dependent peptidase ImmA (M78 family)
MGIIRNKVFVTGDYTTDDAALIDSPDKLLAYARRYNINVVPLDIDAIAERLGVLVKAVPMEGDMSGRLYRPEDSSQWIVEVNKDHHPNRQRYTIAHELGHFCLHKHLKHLFEDQVFFRGGEPSKEEWQANDFASAILMPESEFRESVRSGITDIEKLSEKFEVSTLALRIRAKNLGFSGHGL